ncbi:sigma 54-interacting transcriptional regulator [Polyangium aurulentum]|uniref:sigma 54-interacting transcriptional regulator n=1 Tax=Polyangium aurulentum TaxID=2567896 RepID=UPI0010ADA7D6|nr:sigma 54-interacting transcriptional regulator [Polyangium aurulentum]UQA56922.1 sigma 54-interacting transcriptional regulator [Polyangium aurulentum]
MSSEDDEIFDDQVQTQLSRRPGNIPTGFALAVVAGPSQGQRFTIAPHLPSRVFVGQSQTCDLSLDDRQVSRRHAAFELIGDRLRVTDLGSTNGTLVQGVTIMEALLSGGETVSLGATQILVERLAGEQPLRLPTAVRFGRTVGASPEMRALYPLCERLAASNVPVLIEGETGTGKEVLAESIHEMGPRKNGPFVVFDCTAVPPNLVESALFGHERGSFTGATEARRGVFEEAHGGTLLLDEIGDLELPLQAKLLRALERSEVQRVGSNRWVRVDVRILAATRRDLDHEIQAGRFRDDLFYRLAVARIELPPLRRRAGDVLILAQHFWRHLAGKDAPFPAEFARRIEDYAFPGNVRELHNAVARRVALGEVAPVETRRPGAPASGVAPPSGGDFIDDTLALDLPLPRARERVVEEFERRYVQRVLAQHNGNVSAAAAASGIARRYFQIIKSRTKPSEPGAPA